jgi:EAL domain-containing protein (putative c-di-GMP-specific phosphodiesterase class I)
LAQAFNREVIAEGVETSEHGFKLLLMGCEQAQGYGIARPMPAEELPAWLNEYQPNEQWMIQGNQVQESKDSKRELFNN